VSLNLSRRSKKQVDLLSRALAFDRARVKRFRAREAWCLLGTLRRPRETFVGYRLNQSSGGLPCRWPQCQAEWPNQCRPQDKASWIALSLTLRSWTLSVLLWLVRWLPGVTERYEKAYRESEEVRQDLNYSIQEKNSRRPLASVLKDPFGIWHRLRTSPRHLRPLDASTLPEGNLSQRQLQLWWAASQNNLKEERCLDHLDQEVQEMPLEHPSEP